MIAVFTSAQNDCTEGVSTTGLDSNGQNSAYESTLYSNLQIGHSNKKNVLLQKACKHLTAPGFVVQSRAPLTVCVDFLLFSLWALCGLSSILPPSKNMPIGELATLKLD